MTSIKNQLHSRSAPDFRLALSKKNTQWGTLFGAIVTGYSHTVPYHFARLLPCHNVSSFSR